MDDLSITKKMVFAFSPNYSLKQKQLNNYTTELGAFDKEAYEIDQALKNSREKLGDVLRKRQIQPETLVTPDPFVPSGQSTSSEVSEETPSEETASEENGKRMTYKKGRTWSNWTRGVNTQAQREQAQRTFQQGLRNSEIDSNADLPPTIETLRQINNKEEYIKISNKLLSSYGNIIRSGDLELKKQYLEVLKFNLQKLKSFLTYSNSRLTGRSYIRIELDKQIGRTNQDIKELSDVIKGQVQRSQPAQLGFFEKRKQGQINAEKQPIKKFENLPNDQEILDTTQYNDELLNKVDNYITFYQTFIDDFKDNKKLIQLQKLIEKYPDLKNIVNNIFTNTEYDDSDITRESNKIQKVYRKMDDLFQELSQDERRPILTRHQDFRKRLIGTQNAEGTIPEDGIRNTLAKLKQRLEQPAQTSTSRWYNPTSWFRKGGTRKIKRSRPSKNVTRKR